MSGCKGGRGRAEGTASASGPYSRVTAPTATKDSQVLGLKKGLFTWKDLRRIVASLKRSAEESAERVRTARRAKAELRRQFGPPAAPPRRNHVARKKRPPSGDERPRFA